MRKAKIICTIGPASDQPPVLDRLLDAGMNVARLNFSHGSHDAHAQTIAALREAASRRRKNLAILQDLQGPRLRLGELPSAGVQVEVGQRVRLTGGMLRSGGQQGFRRQQTVSEIVVPVAYPQLARDVRPGARMLIDDGLIELRVVAIEGGDVVATVVTGGMLTAHKGLNLPGTSISEPTMTDKDREDLAFGIAQAVDYVALSFVRGPGDITAIRQAIRDQGGWQPVIAKIERAEAIDELESIVDQADGLMVARGDLGVEMGPEIVPILQKRIIHAANRAGRPVITATQMLESMTRCPRPTRAEASDVANAVFDGTDVVMLSGETAVGAYPVESLSVMDQLVRAAEEAMPEGRSHASNPVPAEEQVEEAVCRAASSSATAIDARVIVAVTQSGRTARLLAKQRPRVPIVALTLDEATRRRLAFIWGVQAECVPTMEEADQSRSLDRFLTERHLAAAGDRIVLVSGDVPGRAGGTNVMKLHEVG